MEPTLRIIYARLQALPWGEYADRTADGLRLCWAVAQLLALAAAIAGRYVWDHRQQIRDAAVATYAAVVIAAELTLATGRWSRHQLEVLSARSAKLTHTQPVAAVAPITAGLEALREALAALIARLYPEVA